MAVESAPREARPASRAGDNQQHAHSRVPTEDELTTLFDEAMKRAPPPGSEPSRAMTADEQAKFLKAMGDPEFRTLLNDYMQEISDPAHRAETEKYLAQLEREQKVPEDKLLLKPTPGFVVKTKWEDPDQALAPGGRKMFVNVCSSEKLQPPSSTKVETGARAGTSWSLPYSVGPERMEPDKSGGLVVTYDVCFHPRTLQFATLQKPYRDMVVKTCLDAVEPLVRKSQGRPRAVVSRDYHVLKGVLYKSGEPVTMCLSAAPSPSSPATDPERKASESAPKIERLEPTADARSDESPAATTTTIRPERPGTKKPLIEEVDTASSASVSPAPARPLPKLEYRIVYRGKFEMLDHMQATLNSHETPAQLPNRPRELAVEISFPTHTSARGIELDVNDRAIKVDTAGYEPLRVRLPFAVVEEKGSAKFDKKARKLVVTLPVQPPEPAPVKRMAIVEQEEEEDEDEEEKVPDAVNEDQEQDQAAAQLNQAEADDVPPKPSTTSGPTASKDDAFAMLRETAMMVANDPLYLPREPVVFYEPSAPTLALPTTEKAASLDKTVKAHVANDASYDDLPPLESCSEGEDDIEMDLQDMLAMETASRRRKQPKEDTSLRAASQTKQTVSETVSETARVRSTPPFTVKETASCLSYLVEVVGVDASTVKLETPSTRSFRLVFSTNQPHHLELRVDELSAEIDVSKSECHVASENVAVILYKTSVTPATANELDVVAPSPASAAPSALPSLPPPAPIVRFQNELLYDID